MAAAKSIMIQGTSSNVGKSMLCTALCRIFYREGYSTSPFKAQNMALNSAVTPEGGEIGRAQAVQAEAAGVSPSVLMNPILLKPKQDMHAQVVVLGRPLADMSAREYRDDYLPEGEKVVIECIKQLKDRYEILIIEGAGSPAEINLKDRDIVNMKTAAIAEAPVLLVADIDRGGVFASLIGTLELLEPEEKKRIKGFIINKFRGDIELLKPGLDFLEARTGLPVLGVVPYIHDHGIEEEDSVSLTERKTAGAKDALIQIAVLQLPRISNFTDINPLYYLPDTRVRFVKKGERIGAADVVIIPGTKNSILDCLYLKEQGYDEEIKSLARQDKYIVGICGGYQMLGEKLLDPYGTEAGLGTLDALGLLPFITTYGREKTTHLVEAVITSQHGFWRALNGERIKGYEIHMGQTRIEDERGHLLQIRSRSDRAVQVNDGCVNEKGNIFGTHLHGFFDNIPVLLNLVNAVRQEKGLCNLKAEEILIHSRELNYDRVADIVRQALDMEQVYAIMDIRGA